MPRGTQDTPDPAPTGQPSELALAHIRTALTGLRFGEITVIVQDGVVVQIERTERTRLPKARMRP